jgi:microcystin-dependent protein
MANFDIKENLDIKSNGIAVSGTNALPKTGDIIPFAGTVAPTGWVICDGGNGTPDLRGFFIVGATSAGNIGATYGNATHSHTTSVAGYGISNAVANSTHFYNSITGGVAAYTLPAHTHNGQTAARTSGSADSNVLANSTSSTGSIAFVNKPHTHAQSSPTNSGAANTSNHDHNGANVSMNTGTTHSAGHSVANSLVGNLDAPTKHYQPFIIMNYIMKV